MIPRPRTTTPAFRLISRMKKLMLAAAVLMGGMAISQAGIDVRIGLPLPLPRFIVGHPAPYCPPPVVVCPPVCPPRVVVSCPPPVYYGHTYRYGHRDDWRGQDRRYDHGRGYGHRR